MPVDLQENKGVIAIATTPFDDKNHIDYDSVDRLPDYYLESGVSGVG